MGKGCGNHDRRARAQSRPQTQPGLRHAEHVREIRAESGVTIGWSMYEQLLVPGAVLKFVAFEAVAI